MRRQRSQSSMNKLAVFLIIIFLIIGVAGFVWWAHGSSALNPNDKSFKLFVVQSGESLREIANSLQQNNLIVDTNVFSLIVKQNNLENKLQAGEFKLSSSMTPFDIAQTLTKGSINVWITIPEGKRATEIAQVLKMHFPQYTDQWQQKLVAQEGYLFPDTYLFPQDVTIDQIISTMKDNFNKKFDSVPTNPDNQYTEKQIVTVASLVEREAKYPEDRPLVASVIYNRLNSGMPLQIDASIQYALGTQANWWPVLTDSGGNILPNSPYNTYTRTGLPPTPISNPGLSSLAAAIKPAQTKYFYYVSDKNGHNHYESTLKQHNADIVKYGL